MNASAIYRSAALYELAMLALYRRAYRARLALVARQVPARASVLELCPGPGMLYRAYLRHRGGPYRAIEVNPRFVRRLRRLGAAVERRDLRDPTSPLPPADVVIMQASLYHFLPDASGMVERMLAAASQRVIIAEPVRNLSDSAHPLVASVARRASNPGAGDGHTHRFDTISLDQLLAPYADRTTTVLTVPGGREKVYVLDWPPAAARAHRPSGCRSGTGDGP